MKHSLPRVAACAIIIAGACAQTALAQSAPAPATPGNVNLYGLLDVFMERAHTGQGAVTRLGSGGIYSSRIGFFGSEDLGGGLKANFLLESLFGMDTGVLGSGGRLWGRTALVGLEHRDLGKLELGRMGTQSLQALSTFNMARYGAGNFLYNPASTMTHDNTVKYTSPKWGPVSFTVNHDFGEAAGSMSTNRSWSAMAMYTTKKATAVLGRMTSNAPRDISATADAVTLWTAGFSYDFGSVKPLALVQRVRSNRQPRAVDRTMVNFGLAVPVGRGSLRLEYEMLHDKATTEAGGRAVSVRYDYPLSKRTTVYAGAVKIRNDRNAYYPIVGASGSSPVTLPASAAYNGTDPSSMVLGLALAF